MICRFCGKRIPDRSQICPKCGMMLEDGSSGLKAVPLSSPIPGRDGSYHAVTGSESSYADDSVREGMRNSHSQFSRKTSASSGHDNSPSSERGLFFWLGVVALVTLIAGMWGLVALIATLIPVNLLYFGSLLFWRRSPGCLADHYGLIRTFITIALYLFAGLMLVSFVNYLHLLIVVPLFPGLLGLEPATM